MMGFIADMLKGLLGFVASALPDSPVSQWIGNLDTLQVALGWLNWVFPLGTCVGLLALYLGLLLAWAGVRFLLGKPLSTAEKLVG